MAFLLGQNEKICLKDIVWKVAVDRKEGRGSTKRGELNQSNPRTIKKDTSEHEGHTKFATTMALGRWRDPLIQI